MGVTVAPIRTERDYNRALAEIESLMDAERGTPDGDRLDVLVTLVEAYEARRWVIDPPDPVEAIKIRMAQRGLTRRYLEHIIGSSGRVSEVLNGKRSFSIDMMRRLHAELDIPAASFLRYPAPRKSATAKRRKRSA
ncbi:MAG: helix-turn-helix domain-containing protein [Gemmatimonadaceae bacterium]